MRGWISNNWKEFLAVPLVMVLVTVYVLTVSGESSAKGKGAEAVQAASIDCTASTRAYFGKNASISCPALPDTPFIAESENAPEEAGIYEDWAWKSFVALNWPAIKPTAPAYYRGFPNYSSAFGLGKSNTTPVWGTWKEKRELFSVNGSKPPAWNNEVDYFVDFPACSTNDAKLLAQMENPRVFAQAGKGLPDSFDETVQVPSEAKFPSTIAHASVQPKVWRQTRDQAGNNAVVYEVKLNYDYYDYVRSQNLYNDTIKTARAAHSGNSSMGGHPTQSNQAISFPWRLTPPSGGYNPGTFNPANNYAVQYCQQFNSNVSANPCPTGTIQTKSAWVQLSQAEVNSGTYHWVEGQFYRHDTSVPGNICTAYGQFGMVGFHIIQKTIEQGHYIYATWEHVKNDSAGFVYANYFKGNSSIKAGFYPNINDSPNAIKVQRDHAVLPSTTNTTNKYHGLIKAVNPSSQWLNYQLTGVQYLPVQCYDTANQAECVSGGFQVASNDPTNIGQPFYLANLVIETSWGLQNFQGVPPGKANGNVPAAYLPTEGFSTTFNSTPFDYYHPNETTNFDRSLGNIGNSRRNRGGRVFNMGGCMGCHGISQADGTDFSFVLLFGQGGADVDTVNAPPP